MIQHRHFFVSQRKVILNTLPEGAKAKINWQNVSNVLNIRLLPLQGEPAIYRLSSTQGAVPSSLALGYALASLSGICI